jgi:hypothetical protein
MAENTSGGRVPAWTSALAFLLSILILEFGFTAAEVLTPGLRAPVRLFPLNSEEIGIDLYGAVLPLVLCLLVGYISVKREAQATPRPFRGAVFWTSMALSVILTLAVFGYIQEVSGSLALTGFEGVLAIPVVEMLGVLYCVYRGPKLRALTVATELYVVGVTGAVLGDVIRTLSGWVSAPLSFFVWGGGGLHDLVFWIGLYAASAAFVYREISSWLVCEFKAGREDPMIQPVL